MHSSVRSAFYLIEQLKETMILFSMSVPIWAFVHSVFFHLHCCIQSSLEYITLHKCSSRVKLMPWLGLSFMEPGRE